MKKSLLLAAACLLGLAPNANAIKQIYDGNIDQYFKDGDIIALQTPSNTGGKWSFWNGADALTVPTLTQTGLLKVVAVENSTEGKFHLQNYTNPDQYIASGSVVWTDKAHAAEFTGFLPDPSTIDDDGTYANYIEMGKNTVRLAIGNNFLNCQNSETKPAYKGGIGGWSWWFVYVLTEEEAEGLGTTFNPEMIQCYFTYDSPQYGGDSYSGVVYDGMPFEMLSGLNIYECAYLDKYAQLSSYFDSVNTETYDDPIISATNNRFHVTIDWNEDAWMADWQWFRDNYESRYSKVGRYTIDPGSTPDNISYSVIYDGKLRAKNPNKLFDPGHMWYFDNFGLDPFGRPTVHMMSVQFPGKGLFFDTEATDHDNNNPAYAEISDTPSPLSLYPTSASEEEGDFMMGITDGDTRLSWFINNRSVDGEHYFSTWYTNYNTAKAGSGCVMRYTALSDDEFDQYKTDVYECGYHEYVATHDNGVDISDEAINKAKESRSPEDVTAIFPVNMNLLNGLRTYKDMTGISQLDNDAQLSIPGYVSAATCKALYDALEAFDATDPETDKPVAEARWALVDGNPAINMEPTLGAIYTIQSTDTDTRGYLCNTNGQATSTMGAVAHDFDAADPDFQFTFVKIGDTYYMYNLGAAKFMNAFGDHTDIGEDHPLMDKRSSHTWRFDDMPTPIRTIMTFKGVLPHSIAIAAGMTSGSTEGFSGTHEGGITVIAGCNRNLLVSMGVADRGDGNGLYMAYAGALTDEQLAEITTKAEEAIASVPSIPTEFEQINGVVNHFTDETHAALSTTNGGTHDHIAYLLENGTRQQFDDTKVYNLFVDANTAYKYDVDTDRFITAEFNASDATFNVKAVKATAPAAAKGMYYDGEEVYSFTHTYDKVAKSLEIGGNTQHTLDMSELGKVKIGDQVLTAKVGTGEAVTTQISEITAGNGADVIYDLQGRRMAAPVKGINIINGKKVRI